MRQDKSLRPGPGPAMLLAFSLALSTGGLAPPVLAAEPGPRLLDMPAPPGETHASPKQVPAPVLPAPPPRSPGGSRVADPWDALNQLFDAFKSSLPTLPLVGRLDGQTILPTIKKVYPTGEKPLVIFNFKCPTELLGVSPPPMQALHELINFGLDGVNRSNLLPFNMQQVCS